MEVVDARREALRRGIGQLDDECLARLHIHMDDDRPLVLDEVHHDVATDSWCALAVALDVPRRVSPTDLPEAPLDHELAVLARIKEVGIETLGAFDLNPTSGIAGSFYTTDRYGDLRRVVDDELRARAMART